MKGTEVQLKELHAYVQRLEDVARGLAKALAETLRETDHGIRRSSMLSALKAWTELEEIPPEDMAPPDSVTSMSMRTPDDYLPPPEDLPEDLHDFWISSWHAHGGDEGKFKDYLGRVIDYHHLRKGL